MKRNNYFVEGLQGAGKTSFVRLLSERLRDYKVFREGDFSPVELAWCAYVTEEQYQGILANYPSLGEEIKGKTVTEEEHKIIAYTQILTDVPNFHRNLEKFEIYNDFNLRPPYGGRQSMWRMRFRIIMDLQSTSSA